MARAMTNPILVILCSLVLTGTGVARAGTPVLDLQRVLDNAGYNTGGQTGDWNDETVKALADFGIRYGIAVPEAAPDDAGVKAIIAAATTQLDASYAEYPTEPLPEDYFVGIGDQGLLNIHNWANFGTVLRDGKPVRVPIQRYFSPIDEDFPVFRAAGVKVARAQIGVDSALFWNECDYRNDPGYQTENACYDKAYRTASKGGWKAQDAALDRMADNPVVKLLVEKIAKYKQNGIEAIVVPADFFWGGTSSAGSATTDPLLHVYLEKDPAFQKFFVRWIGALVGELKRNGLTNISLQSLNEPRWCGNGGPTKQNLTSWTALERAIFDAARRVAPRISLVGAAICTSGSFYFDNTDLDYAAVGKVLPLHPGIDNITYSIHIRSPRALLIGNTDDTLPGLMIPYPFEKPLGNSGGVGKAGIFKIKTYNRIKPDAGFYDRVFSKVAGFADANGIRLMVTEFDAPKPDYGVTREDRIAVVHDVLAAARTYKVPIIYMSVQGAAGLASCPDNRGVPDHRFDSALMNLIAYGNSVVGADPDKAVPSLESECGPQIDIELDGVLDHQKGNNPDVNTLLSLHILGGKPGEDVASFNIQGKYDVAKKSFDALRFVVNTAMSPKEAAKLTAKCPAVATETWDDDNLARVIVRFRKKGQVYGAENVECITANAPSQIGFTVRFAVARFAETARNLVLSGQIDGIGNDGLREWVKAAAEGDVTLVALPPDATVIRIRTTDQIDWQKGADPQFNSNFSSTIAGAKKGEESLDYNLLGSASLPPTVSNLQIVINEPLSAKELAGLLKECPKVSTVRYDDDGKSRVMIRFQKADTLYRPVEAECVIAQTPKRISFEAKFLTTRFNELAIDMVNSGDIDSINNKALSTFIAAVAEGKLGVGIAPTTDQ